MNSLNKDLCKICHTQMRELFTSTYCPSCPTDDTSVDYEMWDLPTKVSIDQFGQYELDLEKALDDLFILDTDDE